MYWDYGGELEAEAILLLITQSRLPAFQDVAFYSNGEITKRFASLSRIESLSDAEQVMVEIALFFWNGHAITLSRLIGLDGSTRALVFSLYQAFCEGRRAVKKWIKTESQSG